MERNARLYLVQETVLILFLSYLLLLGGTYNGLVDYQFRLVSLALLAAAGLAWLVWRGRAGFVGRSPLQVALLLLLLAMALATLTSIDPRRSLIGLWQVGLALWIFWLTSDLLRANWPGELLVKTCLIVGAIIIGLALFTVLVWYRRWLATGGIEQLVPPVMLRLWSLPGNPNYIAATLNLLWPLALARLLGRRGRAARVLLALWVLLAWLVLYFTSSRGGWLGAGSALLALAWLGWREWGWRERLTPLWERFRRRPLLLLLVAVVLVLLLAFLVPLVWGQFNHYSHRPLLESRQRWWEPAWLTFLERPLLGSGLFTYASRYWSENSVPPDAIFVHAHCLPLHVLSEAGLVGLLALLLVTGLLLRELVLSWRAADVGRRVEIGGAGAALLAAGVHGLVDTVQLMPALALLLALVAALGTQRERAARGRNLAAPVLWLSLMVVGGWSLWAYRPAAAAVQLAGQNAWPQALPLFETAVARDPQLALNQAQLGYAHGMLAADDHGHLASAIDHYRAAIQLDPHYASHHANLALLLWQAGQVDEAIVEMGQAAELAPREPLFALNLATFYEVSDELQAARRTFERALAIRPALGGASAFWRASALRRSVWDDWCRANPPLATPARAALTAGDLATARQQWQGELDANPNRVEPYQGLAAVALAQGDPAGAERWLRTALFVSDAPGARFDLAQLAAGQDDLGTALALAAPLAEAFGRPAGLGSCDYGWYVFERQTLAHEVLPALAVLPPTDAAGDQLVLMASWARALGRHDQAQALCRQVLDAIPDHAGGLECIDD